MAKFFGFLSHIFSTFLVAVTLFLTNLNKSYKIPKEKEKQ